MLKRVYIDNFRCLVNFELQLGRQQLIMGLNGSGKSTLLDALRAIKALVTGDVSPSDAFPSESRTRWQDLGQQTVELEVDLGAAYLFRLETDVSGSPPMYGIKRELVLCDQKPLFEFNEGEVTLFADSFDRTVSYPFDTSRSALATIQRRPDNKKLMRFKEWIGNLYCLALNPWNMSGLAEREEARPKPDMSNFASWYRFMAQEHADSAFRLTEQLRKIIPDLESLDLPSAGANTRTLRFGFGGPGAEKFSVGFDELSEGQRVLVCLYALLHFVVGPQACVFLDEPENFIALNEIQPWLLELQDRLEDGGQVLLVSHHPELINYLAPELGLVFERTGAGPARVRNYQSESTLSPAEQTARGW